MESILVKILDELKMGSTKLCYKNSVALNNIAMRLYQSEELEPIDVEDLKNLLYICNVLYNDTDCSVLPIEDGVYDLLLEKYKKYDPNYQIGSKVFSFDNSNDNVGFCKMCNSDMVEGISFMSDEDKEFMENSTYFSKFVHKIGTYANQNYPVKLYDINAGYIEKRKHNTAHNHPELIGTLDKCKFVLNDDAKERGVFLDANVKILERDFFCNHIERGIISPVEEFGMVMELKYDGVSIEADCTDIVVSARSRGDTESDVAADFTPLLQGYRFPNRQPGCKEIGVKFEAIMTTFDLYRFNMAKKYNYKNCRSAIVGLLASSDAHQYMEYITLIPLAVEKDVYANECNSNRIKELEFLNKNFSSKGMRANYDIAYGQYTDVLRDIKLFLSEADYCRKWITFMYDGIVVSYLDKDKRRKLGRENFVNKFSMAVKFNPLKKQTTFRGYTYTVGQDGSITPMIHYDPVEFYGTIHPKSSGHSYARFKELDLHIGDIIDVEYMNDVMPYVSKPVNNHNKENCFNTPAERFPTKCPDCGTDLVISETGKSVKCPNLSCGARSISRMVNMCSKLGMDGFGEATIVKIGALNFKDLFISVIAEDGEISIESKGFGEVECKNMRYEFAKLKERNLTDADFIGALGFDNVSTKTWKQILTKIPLWDLDDLILSGNIDKAKNIIGSIKGIGPSTIDTIIREYPFFKDDIQIIKCVICPPEYTPSTGKVIRASGFRDKELFEKLRSMGCDADDNSQITKDTDILLVPSESYSSTKTEKAAKYGINIVTVREFKENISYYI